MMRQKLKSYFWWKSSIGKMQRSLRKSGGKGGSSGGNKGASGSASGSGSGGAAGGAGVENAALKRKAEWQRGQAPSGKRRRVRGGGNLNVGGAKVEKPVGADAEALEKEAGEVADM